ncbi:efflux RND transporter permease subunit [uncultured Tateyamaria sp.]|uniref:efflux RND transporter permease subunit n=1 Tax=uncultured Tateyamaria sp. TaxID=455651 RepID=UPI0026127409|nr:efflux RND transporter permease subunit [uncultured Tateyamaria sp.]
MMRYFVLHPVAANILMLAACILGLSVITDIERESFPEFTPSRVTVGVIYSGASAIDVDEQVCSELDDALNGVSQLDDIECESTEGRATLTLTMVEDGDISQFFNDALSEVQAIQDLPEDAEEPTVSITGREEQIVLLAVSGIDGPGGLLRYADELAATLTTLPLVSDAEVGGISAQEFRIALDQAALRRYGMSARDVADAINARSFNQPLGTAQTDTLDVTLRYEGVRRSAASLEDVIIRETSAGGFVRVSDVAEVRLIDAQPELHSIIDGVDAATITVLKTDTADAIDAFAQVQEIIDAEEARLPDPFEITIVNNETENIEDRIRVVVENTMIGLFLVLAVMSLVFSFREAFWISATLPISFLGAFFVMNAMGITINMISLIAMLMAVGLIMDDSIVIADNIDKWRSRGRGKEASYKGAAEVAPGVFSSFLTTACVFTPLMFLSGELGSILEVVPVVLLIVLAVSLVEAFLVLPNHLSHVQSDRARQNRRLAPRMIEALAERIVLPITRFCVEWRYATLGLTFGILIASVGLITSGTIKVVGFPTIEGDTVEARIALTAGSPLERTEATVARLVAGIEAVDAERTPLTDGAQPLVEQVLVRYATNQDVRSNGPHTVTVTVDLLESAARNVTADDVAAMWERAAGPLPDVAQSSFVQTSGTPGGSDLDVQLSSRNLEQLELATADLYARLIARPDVTGAYNDFSGGQAQIELSLNNFGEAAGLTPQNLTSQLRAAFSGTETDEFSSGFSDIAIRVEIADTVPTIAELEQFPIVLPSGGSTPLAQVAHILSVEGYTQITRQNGEAIARIIGQIDRAATTSSVISDLVMTDYAPQIMQAYPQVSVGIGGATEAQMETQNSIITALLVGLVGVYLILAYQFHSYALPLVVMLSIPFAIIGVILGHMIVGIDLAMPSFVGFASLAGIVVNNAILFLTFFEMESEESAMEGAIEAVRHRFRPVLLSFTTTFVGLLPIIFETSPQAQTMVPLVTAVAFGLLSSTLLTIFVLPSALTMYFDWANLQKWRDSRAYADRPEPTPAE